MNALKKTFRFLCSVYQSYHKAFVVAYHDLPGFIFRIQYQGGKFDFNACFWFADNETPTKITKKIMFHPWPQIH